MRRGKGVVSFLLYLWQIDVTEKLNFSEKGKAWLQFFRIGGVTSALSGSLWGHLIENQGMVSWLSVIPLLAVSFCIYLFGMGLNDLVDLRKDRELRSGRPLPSGRLGEGEARKVCYVILLIGCLVMYAFLEEFQVWCFSLAFIFVTIYNLKAKHSRVYGPITVALARSFNVMAGMTLLKYELMPLAAFHFVHTLGIFVVAEGEDRESPLGWKKLSFLGVVPLLMFWKEPYAGILWAASLVWITRDFWGTQARSSAARLVGGLVGAFTLMEACYLLGSEYWIPGLIFVGLYGVGRKLQKTFPAG